MVKKSYISDEQLANVLEQLKSVRVKLGLIAVAEGMMTEAQADSVNRIQAMADKRFGDIAVEKGYLTDAQVSELLKKQGNSYMQFVQALIDSGVITFEDVNKYLDEYQEEKGLSNLDMEMLKSGDTNKEILVLVKTGDEYADKHLSLAIKNVIRFVDAQATILSVEKVSSIEVENLGYQYLDGDFKAVLGFGPSAEAIVTIANKFADEEYTEADEDSYDAVCELTNCINGLFASELSDKEVEIDMLPPMSKNNATVTADNMYVMKLSVCGVDVDVISANNTEITI